MRFVAVWSLRRGVLDPPRELGERLQYELMKSEPELEPPITREEWLRRKTFAYQLERDPLLARGEGLKLTARVA